MDAERRREERAAFARLKRGESGARDELVARHMPLVRHLARRYAHADEPLEDLVQVGAIGLLNAVDRYDPEAGTAFSSFAVPTILGEIRRHFRDRTWSVRVPRSLKELAVDARDASADFERASGRSPTVAELADVLGVDAERVLEARLAATAQYADSLDLPEPNADDRGRLSLQDRLGETDASMAEAEDAVSLAQLTSSLGPRERELLRLRFEEDLTQTDIAARVGLSQMHVSRLLRDALDHVGSRLAPAGLAPEPRPALDD